MQPTLADFEAFLDAISVCFIKGDLTAWRQRILLPFSVVTRDGPVVLKTDNEVAENFDNYLKAVDLMGLSLVDRRPIAFEDCQDGTWLGTYETRLVTNGLLATRPYTSTALLIWDGRMLRMTSILNGRGHHEWTGVHPYTD